MEAVQIVKTRDVGNVVVINNPAGAHLARCG